MMSLASFAVVVALQYALISPEIWRTKIRFPTRWFVAVPCGTMVSSALVMVAADVPLSVVSWYFFCPSANHALGTLVLNRVTPGKRTRLRGIKEYFRYFGRGMRIGKRDGNFDDISYLLLRIRLPFLFSVYNRSSIVFCK